MIHFAKEQASEWATEVLSDDGAMILDCETTGFNGEIIELSIIQAVNGVTLYDELIMPENPITKGAYDIHGIGMDELKERGATTFPFHYPTIKGFLESSSRVVIYNSRFDVGQIRSDCIRHNLPEPEYTAECAMKQYARWCGEWSQRHKNYKYQKLNGGHRAHGDCIATLEVLKKMADFLR